MVSPQSSHSCSTPFRHRPHSGNRWKTRDFLISSLFTLSYLSLSLFSLSSLFLRSPQRCVYRSNTSVVGDSTHTTRVFPSWNQKLFYAKKRISLLPQRAKRIFFPQQPTLFFTRITHKRNSAERTHFFFLKQRKEEKIGKQRGRRRNHNYV